MDSHPSMFIVGYFLPCVSRSEAYTRALVGGGGTVLPGSMTYIFALEKGYVYGCACCGRHALSVEVIGIWHIRVLRAVALRFDVFVTFVYEFASE